MTKVHILLLSSSILSFLFGAATAFALSRGHIRDQTFLGAFFGFCFITFIGWVLLL